MVEQEKGPPDAHVQAFLAMLRQQPTEADCRVCQSQLHDYVVAQQAQEDVQARFAWTRQHLDSCVECAEAYSQLYEMVLAEAQDQLPQPEHIPAPELSFLTAVPHLPTALSQAIQQTQQRFTLQLNELLTSLLAPAPQTALTRSTGQGHYSQKLLELTPEQLPESAIPFTLTAFADQEQPGRCLVEVTVEPPGLSWPDLGGREVMLTAGEHSQTAQTDEWGTAVFPDILILDLDTMRLDVTLEPK
jgi:hypothetical protein